MAIKKSKTKYSWKTSLPAYLENQIGKDYQNALVYLVIRRHRGKKATIKEIQDYLRINFKIFLPQSTISGRIGDLKEMKKIAHYGETRIYRDRLRKVFSVRKKEKKAGRPVAKYSNKKKIVKKPVRRIVKKSKQRTTKRKK